MILGMNNNQEEFKQDLCCVMLCCVAVTAVIMQQIYRGISLYVTRQYWWAYFEIYHIPLKIWTTQKCFSQWPQPFGKGKQWVIIIKKIHRHFYWFCIQEVCRSNTTDDHRQKHLAITLWIIVFQLRVINKPWNNLLDNARKVPKFS